MSLLSVISMIHIQPNDVKRNAMFITTSIHPFYKQIAKKCIEITEFSQKTKFKLTRLDTNNSNMSLQDKPYFY